MYLSFVPLIIFMPIINLDKINTYSFKSKVLMTKKQPTLFCKYDIDCDFPMTCFKVVGDYGICHYDRKKMILSPIYIPVPVDNN